MNGHHIRRLKDRIYRSKRSVGALCFALVVLLMWLWLGSDSKQPLIVYSEPFTMPAGKGPWPDRWIPTRPGWAWLWKVRYAILPETRSVRFRCVFLRVHPDSPVGGSINAVGFHSGPDLSIWILTESDLETLQKRLNPQMGFLNIGDIGFGVRDGDLESLFDGGGPDLEDLAISTLPKVHGHTVDLTCRVIVTVPSKRVLPQMTTTNLHASFRAQIPLKGGVLVLSNLGGQRTAAVISAETSP